MYLALARYHEAASKQASQLFVSFVCPVGRSNISLVISDSDI